jgi:hypothetical protein
MRVFALTAALLVAHPALAEAPVAKPSTDANPVVRIEGDTLTYIGGTNEAGLTALSEVVRNLPRGQIRKMLVNSGGGDTKAGIRIGAIIADLKPDLTIDVGCFSSCANFIAPAAASITIRENAFLGWHGNDRGFQIVADQLGMSLREYLRITFASGLAESGIDIEAWLDEVVLAAAERIAEEEALYKKIGLPNDTFAICGVGPRFEDRLSGDQRGWGFSIADMARLGLPAVRYEGAGDYEASAAFRRWLIQLAPEDCLP